MKSKISVHQAYGPFLGINWRLIKQYGVPCVEAACKSGRDQKNRQYTTKW